MRDEPIDDTVRPLPADLLPDPQPAAGAPVWDAATRRIMIAAGPEFRRRGALVYAAPGTSWSVMGRWWKPAAALAVAATVLLFLVDRAATAPDSGRSSIALGLVASDGDPATLWEALGTEADPVLALIAIREPTATAPPAAVPTDRKEELR